LNAANEVAVHGFLAGQIGFLDIARIVEQTLERVPQTRLDDLADVHAADTAARAAAKALIPGG
jgi:1-deoxy-D-xylulose-5-phosphate reductoisomerase